jgi:hypothetical protein
MESFSWIWIGLLLLVVGVLLFVFMYTLNRKPKEEEVNKKLLINDAINIVTKPFPNILTPFFNVTDYQNNLYNISYYNTGDTPNVTQLPDVTVPTLFIIKYDVNKNVLFTKTIATLNIDLNVDSTLNACIDYEDNLFIVAEYNSANEIVIDDGVSLPKTNNGDRNFVLKLEPDGTATSAIAITEIDTEDISISLIAVLENNFVITGSYKSNDTITLGSFILPNSNGINVGFLIGFVNNLVDYSFVNTLNVVENFPSNIRNFVYNDETTTVTVVGDYITNTSVNLGNDISLPSTNNRSVFLLQYTYDTLVSLTINKSKSLINNNQTISSNIVQDSNYNIYFVFKYNGNSINVDSITLPPVTEYTNLLFKLTPSLIANNVSISNTIDTGDLVQFLVIDLKNNLYISSSYINTSSVNLGLDKVLPPVTETLTNLNNNAVILKYNNKLSLIDFAYVAGTSFSSSICVNSLFNVYSNIIFVSEIQSVDLGNNIILLPTGLNARYITLEYIEV